MLSRADESYFDSGRSGSVSAIARVQAATHRVAPDAPALFVHADNPICGLSMDQVDSIFSQDHHCHRGFFSDGGRIDDWSDVTFDHLGAIELYG